MDHLLHIIIYYIYTPWFQNPRFQSTRGFMGFIFSSHFRHQVPGKTLVERSFVSRRNAMQIGKSSCRLPWHMCSKRHDEGNLEDSNKKDTPIKQSYFSWKMIFGELYTIWSSFVAERWCNVGAGSISWQLYRLDNRFLDPIMTPAHTTPPEQMVAISILGVFLHDLWPSELFVLLNGWCGNNFWCQPTRKHFLKEVNHLPGKGGFVRIHP